ncbi:MAG: hypothetical protein U0Z75_06205 [Deinococcaceae bacterium]
MQCDVFPKAIMTAQGTLNRMYTQNKTKKQCCAKAAAPKTQKINQGFNITETVAIAKV